MNTILGIDVSADLSALDSDALTALRAELLSAGKAALAGESITPEIVADVKAAREYAGTIKATLAERADAEAQLAADIAAEDAALDAEDEVEEAEEVPADEPVAEVEEEVEVVEEALVAAAPSWKPTAAGVSAGTSNTSNSAVAPVPAPAPVMNFGSAAFSATANVDGMATGESFESAAQLGEALTDKWARISGGSNEKVTVAKTFAHFSPEQILTEDVSANYAKFGGVDPLAPSAQAITAALCAPAEPLYAVSGESSLARPVKGSLAMYRPARGKVSVYPQPRLSAIDSGPGGAGRGIWTAANEASASDTKAACAKIACSTPEVFQVYGVYRCMTVRNLLAMTFPELVEAYLNRLGSLTARLAEETLLDAMVGSANTKGVTVTPTNDFDASINLWTTVLNAVAIYREEERYSDQQFDAWIPRWVIPALQIGLVRQRRTSGNLSERLPSVGEISATFRAAGVDVTWTMDSATTWADVDPAGADGDPLPELPTTVDILMSPKGNFRGLDLGELSIGVAAGNIYRDNASNSKNEFTMFQENFEGLMDFGAISYNLTIDALCFNGAQTADVTAIDCTPPGP